MAPAYAPFPPPVSGSTSPTAGGSTPAVVACPDYLRAPVVRDAFTIPGVGLTGQFYSQCAYLWASPGADLYIAPLGSVNILGVSDNLITYRNTNISVGTIINPGQLLVIGIPQSVSSSTEATQLDKLRGFLNSQDKYIVGETNQLLRWNQVGADTFLQNTNGMIFLPNAAGGTEIPAKDISGSALATTPLDTPGTGVIGYYDLPNLPAANLLPATFYALIRVRLSVVAIDTTAANAFTVKHNGVEIMSMTYSFAEHMTALVPCTSTKLALEFTKLNNKANCFARVFVMGYQF